MMERELSSLLGRVRRRWFRLVVLRTLGRVAPVTTVPLLAALVLDATFRPQGWTLIAGAAAVVAGAAAGIFLLVRNQRRPDDRLVARYVEEQTSAAAGRAPLDDALVSAVDVAERRHSGGSPAFSELIIAGAVRRLQAIDPADVIPQAVLKRAGIEAGAGVLALVAVTILALPSVRRAAATAWVAAFPDTIRVEVHPGDLRVVAGEPVRIGTTVRGRSGIVTAFSPLLTVQDGAERRMIEMTRDGDGFRFDVDAVERTFRYRVAAGTAVSTEYTVTAVHPPRVERIDLRYVYPSFSGLAPRDEADGGDIYAPAGTRVRLRVHADRPVAGGELALTGSPSLPLRGADGNALEAELTLARDDSYRVHLVDPGGLRGRGDTEYFIRLMDDRPPDVRIIRPSRDQQITPLEEVSIEARADDDHGIAAFDLVYSVSGGRERTAAFRRVTGTSVQKTGAYLLPAEALGVQPGDVITYYARARDVGRGKRPSEAKSDMFFLEVKPFGEEFVAAQSMAGGAAATQLEALIAAQKEIINATWNVERRSGGGRSADDVQAIARAQAELRARAEQLTAGGGRAGRPPYPQRLGAGGAAQPAPGGQPSGAANPIGAALAAMTRAQQQLEAQQTREAIPHEMAALNALLQAQAEVRRRQVAQQRGTGSGGSNRAGEDLSALFDRELQRQQRTNYESRSQVEERPDRADAQDSSLERIRDLARRQEELNRQQRELAAGGLDADEIKRRLERLTREQEELRRQTEQLAKQGDARAQANPAMGDVSEQMRRAAGDLKRQDTRSAVESGERAAGQLRSIERQARGGSAGERQRAAGQLQLEARQIAESQRRLAAEAERLERDGAASAEARRRLADEKDRLAGRVDELQRAAAQERHTEAARELQAGRVGQRMRETTKLLRDGSQRTSPEERQLARALEQVADTLGGGGDTAARQLADELKRTQEIRDRLNQLEQQMRAAEARERQQGQRGRAPGQRAGDGRGDGAGRSRSGSAGESGQGELERLRAEYHRELQRAQDALSRLQQGQQHDGEGGTPEQHEYSRSAPGTEQFKQDRSRWESLRKDVDLALERYEAGASDRLSRKGQVGRLNAGGSERVPDKYRDLIAKYFQSLATGKRQ